MFADLKVRGYVKMFADLKVRGYAKTHMALTSTTRKCTGRKRAHRVGGVVLER